jgi:hypothetical protein
VAEQKNGEVNGTAVATIPGAKNGTAKPMATPKETPDPLLNLELGVERILPFSFWGDGDGNGGGEITRDASLIPIEELVNMRRRDGQARALIRLFTLPILAAFADGEWIAPPNVDLDEADAKAGKEETAPEVTHPGTQPGTDSQKASQDDEKGPQSDAQPSTGAKDGKDTPKDSKGQKRLPYEAEVEFANEMWNLPPQAGGMKTTKTQVLKRILLMLTDGFAAFEEVRTVPEKGVLKGKVVLDELAYRDSRTLRFRVDDKGKFNGLRQIATVNGKTVDVVIPPEKCFVLTNQGEENPFYGVSLFEAAYEHYQIKRKLYYIAHLAAQFAAVPGRIGEVPQGAAPQHITAFKTALANFAFNTAAVMPPGFKVVPFNANSGFDFLKLIDHHNHMMSKSVLSGFIDSEQRATLIEIGRTDPNTDFFILALEAIMDEIAEELSTSLMPKYIDWNFGTGNYPVFKFGVLSDTDKAMIKDIFASVVTSSVLNSTPEFVRELEKKLAKSMDLDIDYDEIEAQEKKAAEEAANAAQSEADMLMNPQGGGAPGENGPQDAQNGPSEGSQPNGGPGGQSGAPSPSNGNSANAGTPPTGAAEVGLSAGSSAFGTTDQSIDALVKAAQDLFLSNAEEAEAMLKPEA